MFCLILNPIYCTKNSGSSRKKLYSTKHTSNVCILQKELNKDDLH
jgi:hypothetical protein